MGGLVAAAVVPTAWIVVPGHVEPGLQSALKLAVLTGIAALLAFRARQLWCTATRIEWATIALLVSAMSSAIVSDECDGNP